MNIDPYEEVNRKPCSFEYKIFLVFIWIKDDVSKNDHFYIWIKRQYSPLNILIFIFLNRLSKNAKNLADRNLFLRLYNFLQSASDIISKYIFTTAVLINSDFTMTPDARRNKRPCSPSFFNDSGATSASRRKIDF